MNALQEKITTASRFRLTALTLLVLTIASATACTGRSAEPDPDSVLSREAAGPMSLSLEVHEDPKSGYNIHVVTKGFYIAPHKASTAHVNGQGYLRVYVNGDYISRMYSPWHHIGELTPGQNIIRVELSSNDHVVLTDNGQPVSASTTVQVALIQKPPSESGPPTAQREGVVHTHEDGTSHTHGAGAPEEWVVIYNSDGEFVPERLEIITGDTVTWKNESDYGVWPASNIHPSHEIYPEFDPLGAIPPGASWSFVFDRNGTWRYHNHSLASETGVIISSGGPEKALEPLSLDVDIPQFPDVPEGFDPVPLLTDAGQLEHFVSMYGPNAAVRELRKATEITGRRCHDPAHDVGRLSYELFGSAAFSIAPHECDSGAIHGVLEAMFAERGTSRLQDDMRTVCSSLGNWYRVSDCYHGVGHGIMAWTSYELHESLELCDVLKVDHRGSCYAGVFMENGVAGTTGLSDHSSQYVSLVDPHYPCNEVKAEYVRACYDWQPNNLLLHMKLSPDELIQWCVNDTLGQVRALCVRSWASLNANSPPLWSNPEGLSQMCESDVLRSTDRNDCIDGVYMSRFSESASAQTMAGFCAEVESSEIHTQESADWCYAGILGLAPFVLDDLQDPTTFCDMIEAPARLAQCITALLSAAP